MQDKKIKLKDLALIKLVKDYYYKKSDKISIIKYRGETFYNSYEKVSKPINDELLAKHLSGEIQIAHSLIKEGNIVENIVIDYNGSNTGKFYQKAQVLLKEEGFINFTAFNTKTNGHLHIYIHKGYTSLEEAYKLSELLSLKLSAKHIRQWDIFPNYKLPLEFNILNLPLSIYHKERGAFWTKHI